MVDQNGLIGESNQRATGTSPLKHWIALAVIGLVIVVIVTRNTKYFTQPRFWAEEGSLHFAYSFSHPWYQALIQPQKGYLNFWANLATVLATVPPLESAPLVTTLMALLVQLIPFALILWSESPLWKDWWRKLAGVAVMLFVPLTSEGWLNSINSYTFLACVAFLILIEPAPESRVRRWIFRVLLVIAGLTGTLSCFLIPLFAFCAMVEKKRERWVQVLLLSACAVVQVILILSYNSVFSIGERYHVIGLNTIGSVMWTQSIGLLAIGLHRSFALSQSLTSLYDHDMLAFQAWGYGLLVASIFLLTLLSHNLPPKQRLLFLGSYGILLILTLLFTVIKGDTTLLESGLHQRLFLPPNVILGWMLVMGIQFNPADRFRIRVSSLVTALCILLLSASLFWGIKSFYKPWVFNKYWPDWSAEVRAWRANPKHALQIQPAGGWYIRLKP